jgi:hypothetical protein
MNEMWEQLMLAQNRQQAPAPGVWEGLMAGPYNNLPPSGNVRDNRVLPPPKSIEQIIQQGSAEIAASDRYDDTVAMHGRLSRGGVKFRGLAGDAGYNDIERALRRRR